MAAIELVDVSKEYPPDITALEHVSLKIRDGEFIVLLGPSGCGKSTTLRVIAGLETVSSGEILIDGEQVNDVDPRDRDLAFVFQNYALYPHMTVESNLTFGLRLRKVRRKTISERIHNAVTMLRIDELLNRKPAALSGGERQRVALGRAIVREPKAFLLDEPLSNLDAKLRAHMRTELIRLHRRLRTTMIHVTHDQVEAMTMGQRICIMNEGRVIQTGRPRDVYRFPADTFVAGFLASPPMNLLDGTLVTDGITGALMVRIGEVNLELPRGSLNAYGPYRGQNVILGIRPEDLYHDATGETSASFDLRIDTVEAQGPEEIVVGQIVGANVGNVAGRMGRGFSAESGSICRIRVDMSQVHLFDAETKRLIPRPDFGLGGGAHKCPSVCD
jgi:multiple sugar transport system ATP-binding protein